MTPIVEKGSVEVELIHMYYDSPACKVYVIETNVKRPHVIAVEGERLALAFFPSESSISAAPARVLLHELRSRRHTTIVETSRYSTFVVSVFHPDESVIIYESEPQGDQ